MVSIVGIVLISAGKPKIVTSLSPEMVGQDVVLVGTVTSKNVRGNHVFLRVNGFKAVFFNAAHKQFFREGTNVSLYGVVEEYEGEIELVVRDVIG